MGPNVQTSNFEICPFLLKTLVEIGRNQKILEEVCLPTAQALDINWEKRLIGTHAIHVNYRSYNPKVLNYEGGKCSREFEEVYVWLM